MKQKLSPPRGCPLKDSMIEEAGFRLKCKSGRFARNRICAIVSLKRCMLQIRTSFPSVALKVFGGAPKERRGGRAEKRLSKRVFLERPFLLCSLKVFRIFQVF